MVAMSNLTPHVTNTQRTEWRCDVTNWCRQTGIKTVFDYRTDVVLSITAKLSHTCRNNFNKQYKCRRFQRNRISGVVTLNTLHNPGIDNQEYVADGNGMCKQHP